ncbi:MAG: antibiotic biosynthesis monooxygenase [Tannerella sp.]|jgi:quinol monooxygenase YgiN|nr:antibiotic biosynthesis monooxygenase [Tannerella sp.]
MKKITVILMIMAMTSCSENSKKSESAVAEKANVQEVASEKRKTVVVAQAFVKEGQEAVFIDAAKAVVEATRREPGCLFYSFYQSPLDPGSFIFYEEYKDEAALNAHASSDHFKVFAGAISDILAEELKIETF